MDNITEEKSSELNVTNERYSLFSNHGKKVSLTKEELKLENNLLRLKV